jgi:hypothetical protein
MAASPALHCSSKRSAANQNLTASPTEDHWFDPNRFQVRPEALACALIGLANGDGGTLLAGVSDPGAIGGRDGVPDHVSKRRQAAMDVVFPSVPHSVNLITGETQDGHSTIFWQWRSRQTLASLDALANMRRNHRPTGFFEDLTLQSGTGRRTRKPSSTHLSGWLSSSQ